MAADGLRRPQITVDGPRHFLPRGGQPVSPTPFISPRMPLHAEENHRLAGVEWQLPGSSQCTSPELDAPPPFFRRLLRAQVVPRTPPNSEPQSEAWLEPALEFLIDRIETRCGERGGAQFVSTRWHSPMTHLCLVDRYGLLACCSFSRTYAASRTCLPS
eukprot:352179-Chlamydomonas_euryale.AAC.2